MQPVLCGVGDGRRLKLPIFLPSVAPSGTTIEFEEFFGDKPLTSVAIAVCDVAGFKTDQPARKKHDRPIDVIDNKARRLTWLAGLTDAHAPALRITEYG
jgi:hypothetical protein